MTAQDKITAQHQNIWCALAAAQAEFSAPKKDSTNPAFKSKYADLSSVVEAVAPALSRHGVAFMHYTAAVDLGQGPETCMVTALIHGASDSRMECAVPLIVSKKDMQGFKSATTYAKRIGLESVTGVAPDDDDGNAAAAAPPPARERRQEPPAGPSPEAIEAACASLKAADTLDALRDVFMALPPGVKSRPEVIKAKDDRKAVLETPEHDPASDIDDEIPFQ